MLRYIYVTTQYYIYATMLCNEYVTVNNTHVFIRYGSRGPKEADEMLTNNNFTYTGSYKWAAPKK
jgi:hypothetical protein